jgi:hypothetical protein
MQSRGAGRASQPVAAAIDPAGSAPVTTKKGCFTLEKLHQCLKACPSKYSTSPSRRARLSPDTKILCLPADRSSSHAPFPTCSNRAICEGRALGYAHFGTRISRPAIKLSAPLKAQSVWSEWSALVDRAKSSPAGINQFLILARLSKERSKINRILIESLRGFNEVFSHAPAPEGITV